MNRRSSPGLAARILSAAIGAYQTVVSPLLGQRCRFAPSCSEYSRESILRFGALYGSWLTVRRLARCQPLLPVAGTPYRPSAVTSLAATCVADHPSTTTGVTR